MNDQRIYWLWLSSLTEVSLNAKAALLQVFGSPENAFHSPKDAFAGIDGITRRDAALLEQRDLSAAENIPALCEAKGVRILTPDDTEYPERLKEIFAPPSAIYVRGKLPEIDAELPVAVIGTRHASEYGLKMGRNIAYELSKCGAVVVSGLTAGVDAAAAEGTLAAGGVCIGILGTAIDAAKNKLATQVCRKGALISEYAPGTAQMKAFFRARNRIAAGLSVAVVVSEAPEKSGTRLFVAEALEQGKEIFAVPGNADSETSAGTIRFLREGATLVTHGWEVAEELDGLLPGVLDPSSRESWPQLAVVEDVTTNKNSEKNATKGNAQSKKHLDKEKTPCYIDVSDAIANLTEAQQKIILSVMAGYSSADDLIEATGLSAPLVLSQLTILEIKGFIRRDAARGIVIKEK